MSVPEQILDPESAADRPVPSRRGLRPVVVRLLLRRSPGGSIILVAAVTGALYALAPTLERVVYGDILHVEPAGEAIPLSAQAAANRLPAPGDDRHAARGRDDGLHPHPLR